MNCRSRANEKKQTETINYEVGACLTAGRNSRRRADTRQNFPPGWNSASIR
jgi:hypothetical protein